MGKAHVDLRSVTTVGLDLAKHVFQIHVVDADGRIVIAIALRRKDVLSLFGALPPCVIGLEACGSAHHWARELVKLGHDARLMPPNYVKAYVRRQKNDAADAAAIREAVGRPSMRFVPIRSIGNQAILMHHKVRELWCLNVPSCSTRCAAIWRRSALSPHRDRMEPRHWPSRFRGVIVPSPFAC
jgi:transposase